MTSISDIYWVKFLDDGFVECFCPDGVKKCSEHSKPGCKEYVLKFVPIDREAERKANEAIEYLDKFKQKRKRLVTEISKSINKFKVK